MGAGTQEAELQADWVGDRSETGAQGGLRRPRGEDGEILGYSQGTVKMWWVVGSDGECGVGWGGEEDQKQLKDTGDSCKDMSSQLCYLFRFALQTGSSCGSCHLSASLGLS